VAVLVLAAQTRQYGDPELPPLSGGAPLVAPDASWFDAKVPQRERQQAAHELANADRLISAGRLEAAEEVFKALPRTAPGPGGDDVRLMKAYLYYRELMFTDAKELLEPLATDEATIARRPAVLYYYGRVLFGEGNFEKGADALEAFIARWPALVPE
jgi:uncharacterized protein HemY